MSADALDGWYVSTRALRQCRELKVTPGNVIASMEDADAFLQKKGEPCTAVFLMCLFMRQEVG